MPLSFFLFHADSSTNFLSLHLQSCSSRLNPLARGLHSSPDLAQHAARGWLPCAGFTLIPCSTPRNWLQAALWVTVPVFVRIRKSKTLICWPDLLLLVPWGLVSRCCRPDWLYLPASQLPSPRVLPARAWFPVNLHSISFMHWDPLCQSPSAWMPC